MTDDARVLDELDAWLGDLYGARRWIVATEVDGAVAATARRLKAWGSPGVLGIAARQGTGGPPDPETCELHQLSLPQMPMMDGIHAAEDALRDLPDSVAAAVERFDPGRELAVLGAFFSDGRPVAGRPFWGARDRRWQALDDKTVVDRLWDEVGVPRAPFEVVPVTLEALTAAAARLDRGEGTVWSGDARAGFHGGATYTCHVTDEASAVRAATHLASRCDAARVMPFLAGIPCSAHGIVFPDHVVVLRPAEMVVVRTDRTPSGFLYLRGGTYWDPPPARREELRDVVRRVGEHLRGTLDYRGAFTVDGVMTADGFRPTELNPRVGAALTMMAPAVPFTFLSDALVERLVPPVDPLALERVLLSTADAERNGSFGVVFDRTLRNTVRARLQLRDGRFVAVGDEEPANGIATIGPGVSGGYANLSLDRERTPVGPSLGPLAATFVDWLDTHFGSGLGPVVPAFDPT
ncbi:MAG: hypothetical protein H6738_15470 [Alphaproteobacteria bacterium]|nr:hypothetical protein [Alphaproteobacteria bacterium]MCB9698177.1 hypothetical protein [Alphaproteobacteria bacterium]